jgi:hypothetical protein
VLHSGGDHSRASLTAFDGGGSSREAVRVAGLDALIHDDVAFVKKDVEGFEVPALEGMDAVLHGRRPIVLFEQQPIATERGGYSPFGAWQILSDLGYRFEQLDAHGVPHEVTRPEDVWGSNVVSLPA